MVPDPGKVLRQRGLRVTPQRRAILAAFRDRADEHLSADEVHSRAAAEVPELGRGTVYATLAELTELELLAAVGSPEPVRYETNVIPHEHFRCRLCLRLFDVELPLPEPAALERDGFVIERVGVTAEGTCAPCAQYARGIRDGARAMTDGARLSAETIDALTCARHDSPLGPLVIAASPHGVVRLGFEDHGDFAGLGARARTRRGQRAARERLTEALGHLDAYFAGGRPPSVDIVDWATAGVVCADVLEATRQVAWGEHRSYEHLRETADLPPYECGIAMGTNPMPVLVPCHRVRRGAHLCEDYVGGVERRQVLLDLEAG